MTIAEAYEPPPNNEWVRPIALGVLALIAGVGIVGWWMGEGTTLWFKLIMSAGTVLLEAWAFNASAQWARALERQRVGGPLTYWFVVACSCGGWSLFSTYHGLNVLTADMGAERIPAYVGMTFLTAMLPFAMWAIERIERAPLKPGRHDSTLSVDSFSESPAVMQPPTPKTNVQPAKRDGAWIPKVVAGSALAALISQVGISPRDAAAFERVYLLRNEHPTANKTWIASQAGAKRSTVGRWLAKLDAMDIVAVAAA